MDLETNQEQYLEEARTQVKEQGFYMKRALESANLRQALIHSARMLNQMSTSMLNPRNYYILFMQVFDELQVLEKAFREEHKRGRSMKDLYQSVQYCQKIIPRLYLLIAAGSVYMETFEVKAKQILSDLIQMTKGVQHPIRGLFLRYYFLKVCKQKFPDVGNDYFGDGGDVDDSIVLIMTNLKEMNRLWIRIKSIRSFKKTEREKQRMDLKVTVGENIVRLSRLEGVNLEKYQSTVLPQLIKLVKKTKDYLSQQYLMDCIIQAFPDEFHLHTLEVILETCTQGINAKCDIKTIFIRLMERLADFAANSNTDVVEINKNINIFSMFKDNIDNIIENKGEEIPLNKLLELQVAFLKFSIYCYPTEIDYVNQILKSSALCCSCQTDKEAFDQDVQRNIVKLLTQPLETLSLQVLAMDDYPKLMEYLPYPERKNVAVKICEAVVNLRQVLDNKKQVKQLLLFLKPVLTEEDTTETEPYEFEHEQQTVASIVHLVQAEKPSTCFKILSLFKDYFLKSQPERQQYTLPACLFAYLKLAYTFKALEDNGEETGMDWEQYFDQCKDIITPLTTKYPELALKLFLNLQVLADHCDYKRELDEYLYNLASDPILIYQDELSDSKAKRNAITLIIAFLQKMVNIGEENYETLVDHACQYGGKLLRKSDQCLAVLMCSHLFYSNKMKNDDKIFKCFKKCTKLAKTSFKQKPENVILYVQILNKMLFYLNQKVETIGIDAIQQCLQTIYNLNDGIDKDEVNVEKFVKYLENTVEYIKSKQEEDETYAQIETG